jgi:hypothetical protein
VEKSLTDVLLGLAVAPSSGVQSLQEFAIVDVARWRTISGDEFMQQDSYSFFIGDREFVRVIFGHLLHGGLPGGSLNLSGKST